MKYEDFVVRYLPHFLLRWGSIGPVSRWVSLVLSDLVRCKCDKPDHCHATTGLLIQIMCSVVSVASLLCVAAGSFNVCTFHVLNSIHQFSHVCYISGQSSHFLGNAVAYLILCCYKSAVWQYCWWISNVDALSFFRFSVAEILILVATLRMQVTNWHWDVNDGDSASLSLIHNYCYCHFLLNLQEQTIIYMSGVQNVHTVLLNLPFWPEMDRLAMTILHRMFEVPQLFQYATCDDCLQDDIVQAVLCCIVCAVLHRDIHTHSPYHAIP